MQLNRHLINTCILLVLGMSCAYAQQDDWPRTVLLDEGVVTIYAPQLEAMDGELLYYRAALAYRPDADSDPVFGAGWLKSKVDIDEREQIVRPEGMELTQTRFPDGTPDIQAELATELAQQSSRWNLDFTVAELEAALDAAEAESLAAQKLRNAPPKIIYRDSPAILVTIDGDPVLREIEDSPYQAVINTPFPLITDGSTYHLNAAKGAWYRANSATGPYRFNAAPPRDIVSMVEAAAQAADPATLDSASSGTDAQAITASNAPEIVVSTEPAELIVTDGPADFVPLVDDLLVLNNSGSDVFLHVQDQKYYIVLSGRWYESSSLNGPWKNKAASDLPAAFARIPEDSAQAESRVYVAGTPEAEEAVLDAQIPQTAAVERGEVDIDISYDGEPDFEPVDGTDDLYYAKNTGATVLESERIYYLLEDGVWYVSGSPHGPWVVSDHRPGELETIEPSSPVYNTKYVYVYEATPEVVYVGYTPGYVGSYVYGPTLVYGTGYYYRPWVSPYYYYPRVSTWGFSVGYSSYGGWSFGIGWNYGGWNLNYYSGGYWHYGQPWYDRYWGYWGPRGYCPTPYYGYPRYRHGPYGKRYGYRKGYRHGYRDGYGDGSYSGHEYADDYGRQRHRNLYRDQRQRARVADTRDVRSNNPGFRDDPGPGRNRNRNRESEQRYADNRKIRQSRTGPVSQTDLRNKAKIRNINRAASNEPMVATRSGEVQRAEFSQSRSQRDAGRRLSSKNKMRDNRTGPVSRTDLQQRAVSVADRSTQSRKSVARRSSEQIDTRVSKRSNRQTIKAPGRRVAGSKPVRSGNDRSEKIARPSQRGNKQSRQQVSEPARRVETRPREVHKRAGPQRSDRKDAAPRRTEPARQARAPASGTPAVRQAQPQSPARSRRQAERASDMQPRQRSEGPSRQTSRNVSRPPVTSRQTAPRQSAPRQSAALQNAQPRSSQPPRRPQTRRSNYGADAAPKRGNGQQKRRKNQ